ncbi:MAG TPA: M28 family metallopeptidase [Nocardioidaceae bacterium]|nr:M28 family metallopeptidase [Nocardioidaceae bacterium]
MTSVRRLLGGAAAISVAAATLAFVPAVQAPDAQADETKCVRTNDSVRKLLECVTLEGTLEHEEALQAIADENDGIRDSGSSGYDASAAYVEERMRAAGYVVTSQTFDIVRFRELGPSALQQVAPGTVTYVQDTDFSVTPHSDPGDVTADVTPVDLALGIGNASTSGCEAADFMGFPVGNIALIQRGTCTFEQKGENAAAAGAVGVLFFNQGNTDGDDRQGVPAVTLGNGYTGGIPALSTTYDRGVEFAGISGLRMRLFSNVDRVPATTSNVIAESRHGDPHNVIMAGAHLDSVPEGPGINDNGSGTSSLIEVAEQMAKLSLSNKLRFAWWGAEEGGLVGSTHYVDTLSESQRADIEMYLNFDMVASPNYGLFVYDGDGSAFGTAGPDGSDEIEALFERYYADRDIPSEPTPFNGRSDYLEFINNDIPAGGLFTGAEVMKTAAQVAKWGGQANVAFDPCYHSACDTIDNVSHDALRINADAIAYVTYLYASGREVINE